MFCSERRYTDPRHAREPTIKDHIVLHKLRQDRDLTFGVVVHDLLCQSLFVDSAVVFAQLLVQEALHVRSELSSFDSGIVRSELAIELDVVASDSVIRVVRNGVIVLRSAACSALGRIADGVRVAVWAILNRVLQALESLASQKVIEGAVLHNQNDDILDVVLQGLDRS